ncbi:hypothetical protein [Paracraurococcus lichenis]|uniref:Uncharacterized protein n=1 Tax=Paracraurococcus lichenis TaxID=3064888 RepID=A0ABT9E7Y7_9PROT|nr:hypothetical protein [Paracraurococcus sp. LOR1-02]MDO9712244.1 hypothetical protein [Paracraurococcus sp. LOR1-02]
MPVLVWNEAAENIARGDADFSAGRYHSAAEEHAACLRRMLDRVIERPQRKARPD